MTEPSPIPPSRAQVLLGWFIVWQLVFLLVANVVSLVPRADPQTAGLASYPVEASRFVMRFWSGLTLQGQFWRMFPEFPHDSMFPAVKIVYEEPARGTTNRNVLLLSDFEPGNLYAHHDLFWHVDRLWHYDAHLALIYIPWNEQSLGQEPEAYQRYRNERIKNFDQPVLAYLRWRLAVFQQNHPEARPREAILLFRIYDTPAPGTQPWRYPEPAERPVARWRLDPPPLGQPLESYDPRRTEFVEVKQRHE
jgi:hypothetical protein